MDSATQHILRINKYVWFCLAFVLLYLLVGRHEGRFDAPSAVVWALFAAGVASVSLRTYCALRADGRGAYWNRLFNYVDMALVALLIAATRGIESHLWLLYFALMTFAALYATPGSKRAVDVSVSALYTLATIPHQIDQRTSLPPALYLWTLATHLFILILVSALARRTSADAEERSAELLLLREQMASAAERARIARDVHDNLGHAMVGTLLRLELCRKLLEREPAEAARILREEIPALRAAWNEARDLSFHLMPWEADIAAQGFVPALRRRCGAFAERTGIIVEVACEDETIHVGSAFANGLMRIVQEALTNAARHAAPARIEVRLNAAPAGSVRCVVADDGQGFDQASVAAGVGLSAMRELAETLGGTLSVASGPGAGTQIAITMPA
ncbi:MAG TPA: sensor histidine kinase [Chthonomonadaceae bacterium]|nr:sensor histidine kinase [Chthonomonadaceae bacterium]